MGMDKSLVVDVDGFSGGIWLLWEDLVVQITEKDRTPNAPCPSPAGDSPFLFTIVYGHPALIQRRGLWESLRSTAEEVDMAWLLAGDFKSMLSSSEKFGGVPFDASRVREFQDCLLDTGLVDLEFVGLPFTWFHGGTKERLDRGLADLDWTTQFPDTTVRHLLRVRSDHRPLLIRTCPELPSPGPRPFKFLASWLTHQEFPEVLKKSWAKGSDLISSARAFSRDAAH
ncbi:unnamed protein product [Linum trigynum]|uniref:Reverse transcriptase n=1 Tax=Linum trigynum TaxID=586398 RepID=A0AAV2E4F5_9ROSI